MDIPTGQHALHSLCVYFCPPELNTLIKLVPHSATATRAAVTRSSYLGRPARLRFAPNEFPAPRYLLTLRAAYVIEVNYRAAPITTDGARGPITSMAVTGVGPAASHWGSGRGAGHRKLTLRRILGNGW